MVHSYVSKSTAGGLSRGGCAYARGVGPDRGFRLDSRLRGNDVVWCGSDVMWCGYGVVWCGSDVMMRRDGVMVWVGMTVGGARIWRRPAAQEGTRADLPAL